MNLTLGAPETAVEVTLEPRAAPEGWLLRPAAPAISATVVAVLVLAALGVVTRLWLLAHDPVDADAAVVGLMAQAILHGHFPALFWGQGYGGVEPYVTAAGVAVFGLHPWVVEATPAVLSAVAAVVAWRLGRLLTGSSSAGGLAAAVVWAWSETDVWSSTREYGFRGVTLVCTLLVALAAAQLVDRARRRPVARSAERATWSVTAARWWPWLLLGAAGGLGWWASPEILCVAVPALVAAAWAAWRLERRAGPAALWPVTGAVAAAVVCALPWLVASAHDGFASFSEVGGDQQFGYAGRLEVLFVHTLPVVLGARLVVSGAWLGGPVVGGLVLAVTVGALAVGLVVATRMVPAARPVVAAVVLYPFIEAAVAPTYYWQDARYGACLPPLAVVGAVAGGYRVLTGARRRRGEGRHRPLRLASWAGVVLAALAALSTVAGLDAATADPAVGADSGFAASPTSLSGNPDRIAGSVVAALVHEHLTRAYADYWAAYDLDLVGGGQVAVSPPDTIRDRPLAATVARARTVAWLFVGPTPADAAACELQFQNPSPEPFGLTVARLTAELAAAGISQRTVAVGPMVAVVPARNVPPAWVLQHLSAAGPAPG